MSQIVQNQNHNADQKSGELLLAGWRMLSEVCPKEGCYQPLFLKPKTEVRDELCVFLANLRFYFFLESILSEL